MVMINEYSIIILKCEPEIKNLKIKDIPAESSLNNKYRSLKPGVRPNMYSYYVEAWSI